LSLWLIEESPDQVMAYALNVAFRNTILGSLATQLTCLDGT
jgi:hypothetical protein